MRVITIEGKARTETGSKSARNLRREGQVICELYGGDENIHFSAPELAFRDLVYTDHFRKAKIVIDGKEVEAFLKAISFHPVTDKILHIDFQELKPGKEIITTIPLKLVGVAKGFRDGGIMIQKTRKLKVKVTPENLVESIDVDVTDLEMGKSISVSEIAYEGAEVLELPRTPIVRIDVPRSAKEAGEVVEGDEEEEEAAEGAAPEAPAAEGGGE